MRKLEESMRADLDVIYRRMYNLSDRLEQITLQGLKEQDKLQELHFRAYTLRQEILNKWQEVCSLKNE